MKILANRLDRYITGIGVGLFSGIFLPDLIPSNQVWWIFGISVVLMIVGYAMEVTVKSRREVR